MPPPGLVIEARDVEKTFHGGAFGRRAVPALRGVSLDVPRGAIFGLLGPNGAGKTTLLSIFATLLLPDRGTVRVLGQDVTRHASALRARLNMASGTAAFVWSLRVAEILGFYGRLYGLSGRRLRARVGELLATAELEPWRDVPYNELSTGLRQRLALAKALVNEPELLFLDEPTLGLDPDVAARVRERIAGLRTGRGATIVLTTHYMREAEALCDEIAFIRSGRIAVRGTALALKRQLGLGDVVGLGLDGPLPPWLAEAPGVLRCRAREVAELTADGGGVECVVDDAAQRVPELLERLRHEGRAVRSVRVREPELDEVFLELAR